MSSASFEQDYDLLLPGERDPRDAFSNPSRGSRRSPWELTKWTLLVGISLIVGSVSIASLYALVLWEAALREQCGFKGSIPYWDWTMDWMDLHSSSIWNNVTGFGGDGDPAGPIVVGEGRCVTDGPFSNLRPVRYNHTSLEHCLARGFRNEDAAGRPLNTWFGPESIGRLLRTPRYRDFEWDMENRLHNRMHRAVSGDFLSLTAANDPVFYLHHAQIDHLWWRWQQENKAARLYEYEGKHMFNSTDGEASLSDMLHYGGFTEDIPVSLVMDTEGGRLCYRY
ncbi:Tyrosinase ustQ [Colletotrichum higginsianum]|nr:Tyrosinase ustQ [Colletotrichum higginsianum]